MNEQPKEAKEGIIFVSSSYDGGRIVTGRGMTEGMAIGVVIVLLSMVIALLLNEAACP